MKVGDPQTEMMYSIGEIMDKPTIKIQYYAFQYNLGVEDFNDIDNFKTDISSSYQAIIKSHPCGRGGGVYQFIIDFFTNLTLEDYLKIIGLYLLKKPIDRIVDPILNAYIFDPLKKGISNIFSKNPIADWYIFHIELQNTDLFIYSIYEKSIVDVLDDILVKLFYVSKDLISEKGEFPSEIHIPALFDDSKKPIFRIPLGFEEFKSELNFNDYFKFWGLKYQYFENNCAYDLINKSFISAYAFLDENEYIRFRAEQCI